MKINIFQISDINNHEIYNSNANMNIICGDSVKGENPNIIQFFKNNNINFNWLILDDLLFPYELIYSNISNRIISSINSCYENVDCIYISDCFNNFILDKDFYLGNFSTQLRYILTVDICNKDTISKYLDFIFNIVKNDNYCVNIYYVGGK